jgi:hypothetical protein
MRALRNGLFLVGPVCDAKSEIELVESHYWEIARAYIAREVRSEYFVGGAKALELHISDFSTPSVLIVYTKSVSKQVIITRNHRIVFKIREAGKRSGGNLFAKLSGFVTKKRIDDLDFKILSHEAALLDMLLLQNNAGVLDGYLVGKFLKKFHGAMRRDILGKLVELRYISSINRLREIAKASGYEELYRDCVSVIRDEGAGCFLTSKR